MPPPNRHGAEPGHHSCDAYKCARHPRALHPSPAGFAPERKLRRASSTACESGRHGLSPADKSQHSVTCEECWDLQAGIVLLSVLYRNVPKVIPVRASETPTAPSSSARRLRGARATPTATAVAGRVSELGRVPSGQRLAHTGTAGAADRKPTFTTELLAQRACRVLARPAESPRYLVLG